MYVCIILNFSVFLFVFSNAIVVADKERLKRTYRALECADYLALPAAARAGNSDQTSDCQRLLRAYVRNGFVMDPSRNSTLEPAAAQSEWVAALKTRIIERRTTFLIEQMGQSYRYKFPIFGVEVESSWFWLVSSFVGLVTLFMIRNAADRETANLVDAYSVSKHDPVLTKLVSSTQVLIPNQDVQGSGPHRQLRPDERSAIPIAWIRFCIFLFLIYVPVFSQTLVVYWYISDMIDYFITLTLAEQILDLITPVFSAAFGVIMLKLSNDLRRIFNEQSQLYYRNAQ